MKPEPQPKLSRTEQYRLSKQRRREAQRAAGIVTITVQLNPKELATYAKARADHNGPLEDFAKRALLTGAKFLHNAGNRAGGKKRMKREDAK